MRLPQLPDSPQRHPDRWNRPTRLLVGKVAGSMTGIGRVSVRVSGASTKAIKNVSAPEGIDLLSGNDVLIARPENSSNWVVVAKVASLTDVQSSESGFDSIVYTPSSFQVRGYSDFILAEWEGWAGAGMCYQVQHNSTESETNADTWYTRGSYYLYDASGVETTRYFRVRSLKWNPSEGVAYYSGWTFWGSGTSTSTPSPARQEIAYHMAEVDLRMSLHMVEGT